MSSINSFMFCQFN